MTDGVTEIIRFSEIRVLLSVQERERERAADHSVYGDESQRCSGAEERGWKRGARSGLP